MYKMTTQIKYEHLSFQIWITCPGVGKEDAELLLISIFLNNALIHIWTLSVQIWITCLGVGKEDAELK